MAKYKQLCVRCKKNYVLISGRQFPLCYTCQKGDLNQPITDTKMKKFFDIPEKYYEQNTFLRDIKMKYLRFGSLSEKQIEAFKKVVKELKDTT